jgi:Domain of unknown function (DUF222)
VPRRDVQDELRLGRRLRAMPTTAQALADGEIGVAHAQRLAALAAGPTAAAFPDDEALLVGHARSLGWADFWRTTQYWRDVAAPDTPEDEAASDHAARRVHLSEGLRGTGLLDGLLTATGRATVAGALDRLESELFEADWADARARLGDTATPSDLRRTPAQRRHEQCCQVGLDHGQARGDLLPHQ